MKKSLFFLLLTLTFTFNLHGQLINDIKADTAYIWGYGEASSLQKADKSALDDLISQISVQVASSFKTIVKEEDGNVKEFSKSVISTYSNTSLNQASRKVVEESGKSMVIRYIKKENLNQIFTQREKRIRDYLATGYEAEKQLRISDALNNYYWALLLLRSHPNNQTISGTIGETSSGLLILTIPDRIKQIFSKLRISIKSSQYNNLEFCRTLDLDVKFMGEPAQNFDFTYWYGDSWSNLQSGRDGVGILQLYGEAAKLQKDVRIRFEYIFQQKAQIDKEVLAIIQDMDVPIFKECEFRVPLFSEDGKSGNSSASYNSINSIPTNSFCTFKVDNPNTYLEVLSKIMKAINSNQQESVKPLFTPEGYDFYNQLINYGNAKVVEIPDTFKILRVGKDIVIRAVTMHFSFPNNNRKFIEKVVFTFDTTAHVTGICFALSETAIHDIMIKDKRFATDDEKYFLINMLENYKTAYCLKRIDYIESLFTDDALIIVGNRVVKDNLVSKDMLPKYKNDNDFEFVRKTKSEYINCLRTVFRSNEFVNIAFEDNQIKRARENDKIFGIQISQYYTSQTYADKGYLFLMVDLKDTLKPKIYVRSWQPEKNADGTILGLQDFSF